MSGLPTARLTSIPITQLEVENEELLFAQTLSAFAHIRLDDPFAQVPDADRFDCVWVTIAKLLSVDLVDLDLRLGRVRPQPNTQGLPDDALSAIVEDAGKKMLYSTSHMVMEDDKLHRIQWETADNPITEDFVQGFANSLGVDKVGVAYRRQDGSGHAVVYQRISDTLWEFCDYQGDRNGVALTGDELAEAAQGLRVVWGFVPFTQGDPAKSPEILVTRSTAMSNMPKVEWKAIMAATASESRANVRKDIIKKLRGLD